MNITLPRAVIEQALEALEYMDVTAEHCVDNRIPETAIKALRTALEQPTRSQKMADAGFMPRDTRLTCDECGRQFTRQILPVHKCTALEQPEQEPVTYQDTAEKCRLETVPAKGTLLHTAPPQRKPLTEKEIEKCYETLGHYQTLRPQDRFAVFALARAIEAAHNIKE